MSSRYNIGRYSQPVNFNLRATPDDEGFLSRLLGLNNVGGGPSVDDQGNVVVRPYIPRTGFMSGGSQFRAQQLNNPLFQQILQEKSTKELSAQEASQQQELEKLRQQLEIAKAREAQIIALAQQRGIPAEDFAKIRPNVAANAIAQTDVEAIQKAQELQRAMLILNALKAQQMPRAAETGVAQELAGRPYPTLNTPAAGASLGFDPFGNPIQVTGAVPGGDVVQNVPTEQFSGAGVNMTQSKPVAVPQPSTPARFQIPVPPGIRQQVLGGTNSPPVNPTISPVPANDQSRSGAITPAPDDSSMVALMDWLRKMNPQPNYQLSPYPTR